MSDVGKPRSSVRRQRSIYRVHYGLPKRSETMARPLLLPAGDVRAYQLQVAGHNKTEETKYYGLLQCSNGTVLKPILKVCQQREVDFYERLNTTSDPHLLELKAFVPKYYGCTNYTYNGFEQPYIILEDLTQNMLEPCVMDIKIGKITWDPWADEEKIKREQSKYTLCKQQFGFCIPGYRVHELATGRLRHYGKDHGKKLHGHLVKETFRKFLNMSDGKVCRRLVLQLVSEAWRLARRARQPGTLTLRAASLLLAYDAAALRRTHTHTSGANCLERPTPARRHSLPAGGGHLGGTLSAKGPVYKKLNSVPLSCMTAAREAFAPPPAVTSPWTEALDKFNDHHSFEHNYEEKLSKMKVNYRTLLDQLSSEDSTEKPWVSVKLIDFAHAYFNDDEEPAVDDNFREGIDNLVEILESILKETDDQVP